MVTNNYDRFKTAIVVVVLFVIGTLPNIPFSSELKRLKIEAGTTHVKVSDTIPSEIIQSE
ncbi:hypothetical protein GGR42_000363 [Saonia flava]|uniref:Uncharacterized protein n=1 Tax=Saonia flava TaxID=523696 RepID=A0A846QPA8_9FLAO|nr:hypothetical protein [Saonia flava]NJB69901.1 hypothetical protein [Saonia flava]